MDGWTLEANDSEIVPAEQNEEIRIEDLYWLEDNLFPIISPIKDVGVEFVKNVIYGVPKPSPIVFVSATEDLNVRAQERSVIQQFNSGQERDILWIPQGGAAVMEFLEEEYEALLDDDGQVKSGHREALMIGVFAAKSMGAEHVGMIDGDNWSPMAIREFVSLYARGLVDADYVSLEWRCKPKCGDEGFEWRGQGRTSGLANSALSRVVSDVEESITSSCSGDHAISIELWDEIEHTPNHSGEVNAFVQICEGNPSAIIRQYKTMSPMFHQYGDGDHIDQERVEVLRQIYHSDLATQELQWDIEDEVDSDAVTFEVESYPKTEDVGDNFLEYIEEDEVLEE